MVDTIAKSVRPKKTVKPKVAPVVGLADHNQWVVGALLGIKEDIGELKGLKADVAGLQKVGDTLTVSTAGIRSDLDVMKAIRLAHQQDLNQLSTRIGALDGKVEAIQQIELPAIRQQLAVDSWFATKKNKIIAAISVTLMGVAGSVVGSYVKDKISGTPPSLIPTVSASVTVTTKDPRMVSLPQERTPQH